MSVPRAFPAKHSSFSSATATISDGPLAPSSRSIHALIFFFVT
jgi:hypothetical protein